MVGQKTLATIGELDIILLREGIWRLTIPDFSPSPPTCLNVSIPSVSLAGIVLYLLFLNWL